MAQVSYGTITITDTTDLTTYIRYATKAPLTAASQFQETPTTDTRYIAVLSIPASDPIPAWNSSSWKWLEFIGTDGVSVLGTREIYYLKTNSATVAAPANGSDISQASANVENQWTKSVPTYVINGEYWTCIQTHLDGSPTWVYGSPVLNQPLTDMNHDIDVMKSVTQQSVEDAQGAMSQANNGIKEIYRVWYRTNSGATLSKPSTHVTETRNDINNTWTKVKPIENSNYRYYFYCEETITNGGVSSWTNPVLDITTLSKYEVEALDSRTKTFFFPGDSTYPGAYVVGKNSSDGLNQADISTYGFNTRVTTTGISIGYNEAKVLHLKTTPSPASLDFYKPPTISGSTVEEGELAASLSATGLILSKGGVKAGTPNQSGFIYLSTEPYGSYSINGSNGISDWKEIIGTKFGVTSDGTLYANNAVINGSITLGTGSKIGTTDAATVVTNASTGASAASDLATYKTTVGNTYATKSAAIAEEQLIYIQATSGTNSVNAYPSSSTTTSSYWVTQTGESIPNGTPPDSATGQTPRWTTKRPSYQKNYPVIFVAKQKKTVSGVITCTTPIKDDTTTIIDGGHITTGTIDATKVTVTNLQASSIAVGSSNVADALDTKASNSAEYEVVVKVNSINYTTPSATLIAIPTKLGASTTGSFVWYKNAIGTAHEGTVSTTTNTNDTLTVTDLNALYIAVLQ